MEPPWKSLRVIVVTAFFFDMAAAGAVAVELRRRRKMSGCGCCFGAPDRWCRAPACFRRTRLEREGEGFESCCVVGWKKV
jgi:hypothetical protein